MCISAVTNKINSLPCFLHNVTLKLQLIDISDAVEIIFSDSLKNQVLKLWFF